MAMAGGRNSNDMIGDTKESQLIINLWRASGVTLLSIMYFMCVPYKAKN